MLNGAGVWRCLIIEDDERNANYIAGGFREFGHVAIICRDSVKALALTIKESWDLIILDRILDKDVDGISILSTLRGLGKRTPVIILSALSTLDERVRGLNAGSDDYLAKPFAFSELVARSEALIRRTRQNPEDQMLQFADLRLDLVRRQADRNGHLLMLQPREFRLLSYFMLHPEQVLTRTMLLEAVWNYHFDPQTNVIDVQVSRLRRKINIGGLPQLIHTVRGAGYRLAIEKTEKSNMITS